MSQMSSRGSGNKRNTPPTPVVKEETEVEEEEEEEEDEEPQDENEQEQDDEEEEEKDGKEGKEDFDFYAVVKDEPSTQPQHSRLRRQQQQQQQQHEEETQPFPMTAENNHDNEEDAEEEDDDEQEDEEVNDEHCRDFSRFTQRRPPTTTVKAERGRRLTRRIKQETPVKNDIPNNNKYNDMDDFYLSQATNDSHNPNTQKRMTRSQSTGTPLKRKGIVEDAIQSLTSKKRKISNSQTSTSQKNNPTLRYLSHDGLYNYHHQKKRTENYEEEGDSPFLD
jgi:hypothetical protein